MNQFFFKMRKSIALDNENFVCVYTRMHTQTYSRTNCTFTYLCAVYKNAFTLTHNYLNIYSSQKFILLSCILYYSFI